MCDGLNDFSLKLWDKYGVNYMWNGYYEDKYPQAEFAYNGSNISPYPGYGDQLPYPIFWQNKKSGKNRYSWSTNSVSYPSDWQYYYNDSRLGSFIDNYGIEIIHCYPAHLAQRHFWNYDKDSVLVAKEEFNQTLAIMANNRDKGLLGIPTIKTFMDHQLLLTNVKYIINEDKLTIHNNNESMVKGATFAISNKTISAAFFERNNIVNFRENGKDYVFWINLLPGEEKVLFYE